MCTAGKLSASNNGRAGAYRRDAISCHTATVRWCTALASGVELPAHCVPGPPYKATVLAVVRGAHEPRLPVRGAYEPRRYSPAQFEKKLKKSVCSSVFSRLESVAYAAVEQ